MTGHKKINSNVEVKKVVEVEPVVVATHKEGKVVVKKGGKVASEPVVAVKEEEPVVAVKKGGKVVTEPVVTVKKGGKVVPVVTEPVVTVKKGGKVVAVKKEGKVVPVVVTEPVVAVKKGGKVVAVKKEEKVVASEPVTETKEGNKAKKGGKTTSVDKPKKKAKELNTENVEESDDKKHIRSFKVRLPGSEAFEGRFTGLTPYQAANKALSKYYRESNEHQKEVTFSISESTRNSRKSIYTYVGGRHELSVPVTYTIADGRLITKKYKNVLKKIKKTDEVFVSH